MFICFHIDLKIGYILGFIGGVCALKGVSVHGGQTKMPIPLKLKIQPTVSCLPLGQVMPLITKNLLNCLHTECAILGFSITEILY